jgi:CheY-like chemotaxis protein
MRGAMKLLIVEDNPSVRRVLKTVVAQLADEIRECADGDAAVKIYCAEEFDFVLMDIDLGATSGIVATRRIREFDPRARIIIVTNYDETDLREEARQAGACGYVLKENLFDVRQQLQPEIQK